MVHYVHSLLPVSGMVWHSYAQGGTIHSETGNSPLASKYNGVQKLVNYNMYNGEQKLLD